MWRRERGAFAAVLVAMSVGFSPAAVASDGGPRPDDTALELTGIVLTPTYAPSTRPTHIWSWHAGRKAFYFDDKGGAADGTFFRAVRSIDLDTGQVSASVSPKKWIWRGYTMAPVMPGMAVVDQDTGRLFAAYTNEEGDLRSTSDSKGDRQDAVKGELSCVYTQQPCMGGYLVIDGESLQTVRHIPLRLVRAEGQQLTVLPRAVSYVPPAPGQADGKLLAVVEDITEEGTVLTGEAVTQPRFMEMTRTFVVQFDVATGSQDWITQIEQCRGTRDTTDDRWSFLPHPAAVGKIDGDSAVWVACTLNARQQIGFVRISLGDDGLPADGTRVEQPDFTTDLRSGIPEPADVVAFESQRDFRQVFVGPEKTFSVLFDNVGGRFLAGSARANPKGETWFVFDIAQRRFAGVLGVGGHGAGEGHVGLDERGGRFYVLHDEGLYVADVRTEPLAQALFFPEFAGKASTTSPQRTVPHSYLPLVVDLGSEAAPRRVLFRGGSDDSYRVITDRMPLKEKGAQEQVGADSLDIDEQEGVTARTFDGAARGYGARLILLAGAEGLGRARVIDPIGWTRGSLEYGKGLVDGVSNQTTLNQLGVRTPTSSQLGIAGKDPCTDSDREVVLGFVGPQDANVVDPSGARGTAVPVVLDDATRQDLGNPASRCTRKDWEQLWTAALFGRPPLEEPGLPESAMPVAVDCLRPPGEEAEPMSASSGDPSSDPFFARVECKDNEASGYSYARLGRSGSVVGEALSSYRIYLDPGRGVVSRVESVARGVNLDGLVRIDSVRGVAESWANGRRQRVPEAEREEGYDPNCDFGRTAGTCFRRHLFGISTPMYSCGPCGDEDVFLDAMTRAFGQDAEFRLRQPDATLALGAENGYVAAIIKPIDERFVDLVINSDLVYSVVPTLEVVRYARPGHFNDATDRESRSGRQVYQFAGVEVSSVYGIQCLLVYDAEANTCAAAAEPPAELTIQLAGPNGEPLAGGAFEIRADGDADGVLGLTDQLVPDGTCVTTEDGVGTCSFTDLEPGPYLVSQVAAPPPYAPTEEPFPVELLAGEARTVVFTNVSGLSTVHVKAEGEDGTPLAGATFAVFADPDADGRVAPDAAPAASCETGADGACSMTVPVGSYVLLQTSVPGGLEPIGPLPFVITSGGQVAAVDVVNYPPRVLAAPEGAAGPDVSYMPPPPASPPTLHRVPLPTMGIPEDTIAPPEHAGPGFGGTVERVIRAPGDALRLLARRPLEGAAFAAAAALLALALAAADRRRRLTWLTGDYSGAAGRE